MRRLPAIIIMLLLLVACKKTPDYVISPDRMARLLADIHTAEAVVDANHSSWRTDSSKRALRQSVYARHGVSSEQVDTSFYWYGHHLKDYMKVYDRTIEILEGRIAEAERAGGKATAGPSKVSINGDSVNLWQGPSTVRLSPLNATDFLTFSMSTDRNWERGDRYTLSLRPIATQSPVFMTIVANYNDGTAEYVTLRQGQEGRKQLTLVLDSAKVATNVYGSMCYAPAKDEIAYLDSISLVRTRTRGDNARARALQHTVRTR